MLDRGSNMAQVKGKPLLFLMFPIVVFEMCRGTFKDTKIQKNQNHLEINF
jgi:hypothetical protein